MQHNCVGVGTLACLSSFDFTSSFLLQNDPYGFGLLDLVAGPPYDSCKGSTTISSSLPPPAGTTADDNRGRRSSNDERKKRRLASNRESARRSRVRKQRRLGDLSSQVAELREMNQRLLVELNRVIAKHARIARENAELREEACDLLRRLNEMEVEEGAEEGANST